jgi:hypothetical protein
MTPPGVFQQAGSERPAPPISCLELGRAEVAELEDALDSKSSGALPRAGSTPAFGIPAPLPDNFDRKDD